MIRLAVHSDIEAIIALGAAMHVESRYSKLPYSVDKVRKLAEHLIDHDNGFLMVAERNHELIGMFCGILEEHYFTEARAASDLLLYVAPAHRGGMSGPRLLDAFTGWALNRGAQMITIGVTTGINVETTSKLYQRLGYGPIGLVFEWGE